MLGKILKIIDNQVTIKMSININNQVNLIGLHVVFTGDEKKIIGEIVNIDQEYMIANIIGEIRDEKFYVGDNSKPSFKSDIGIIKMDEVALMLGTKSKNCSSTFIGYSNIYKNYKVYINNNDFFSNHFAVIGNSGAGKSCTVASIIQNLFTSGDRAPLKSNFFFFDAFGEYTPAFKDLSRVNPNIIYKSYTTNTSYNDTDIIKIPTWLLDVDDLALLLDVTNPNQLPILEKTLKIVPILKGNTQDVIRYKNDIIARALEDILLSGSNSTKIRDQVVAILTKFNTEELNLESQIVQPGYVRTLKQCLYIDKTGKFQEIELVTEFIRSFINKDFDSFPDADKKQCAYNLSDLEEALEFALISEGILKSEKVYDYANVLSVRLHSLVNGKNRNYFEYDKYVDRNQFIQELLIDKLTGKKAQIVNFNINYVDDRLAKVITKIISKMLFSFAAENNNRGSVPFNIIIEEAHRYVQKDKDIEILGYNIFERITKEGRKYGVFLGLITQRPSELSDTAISQCSNFIVLRTIHPKDLEYIKNMVPNVSYEIIAQLKNLQPGTCIAFGNAFKVPILISVQIPNPRPNSDNVNLDTVWY